MFTPKFLHTVKLSIALLFFSYKEDFFFQQSSNQTDPKLYFWDIEADALSYFNFDTGKGEQDDFPLEQMVGTQTDSAIEMSDADR